MLPSDFATQVIVPGQGIEGRLALPEERSEAGASVPDLFIVGSQIGVSFPAPAARAQPHPACPLQAQPKSTVKGSMPTMARRRAGRGSKNLRHPV